MGIVKVASCVPTAEWAYSCGDEDITHEEKMLLQSFPTHESDDYEHPEVNCELAKSGSQICSVPYDLYDLPELNGVLSLETWNLCLTEDDRFHLAAHLPDMDQNDFFLTMKELFSGSDMFFGSPVRSFFHRLNGGFYSPEVSQARELLMIFERRRYYHFLKSYHDGMISKFASMDKVSRQCGMSTNLQGKIRIWNDRRHENPLTGVGINNSPFNRSLSIINEDKAATLSPSKRVKRMDGTVTTHCSAKLKGIVCRAKSMEMSSLKSSIFHVPNELGTTCIRLPKGVLKIKTDHASLNDHNEGMYRTPELMPADQPGIQVSSLPRASALDVHGFAMNSAYCYHINTSNSILGNLHVSPYQREGALDTYPLSVKSPFGSQIMVPEELKRANCSGMLSTFHQLATKHSPTYYNEEFGTTDLPHEKNLLKNFGQQNSPESSPDPFTRIIDCHQTNGHTTHRLKTAESLSEVLTLGSGTPAPYKHLSEQSETMHRRYPEGFKVKATPASQSITEVEEGYRYPYTYKRRKLQKRLDLVDPVNKSTTVDSESLSALASIANVESKGNQTLKIGS